MLNKLILTTVLFLAPDFQRILDFGFSISMSLTSVCLIAAPHRVAENSLHFIITFSQNFISFFPPSKHMNSCLSADLFYMVVQILLIIKGLTKIYSNFIRKILDHVILWDQYNRRKMVAKRR